MESFVKEHKPDDLELQANMRIKRHKFAIYKSCVTNFKLKYHDIYQTHHDSPIFHLKLTDMDVNCFEINVYLLKNKIFENDFEYWEAAILSFLQVSAHDRKVSNKNIKRLVFPIQNLYGNDEIKSPVLDNQLQPKFENNGISKFLDDFLERRKESTIYVLHDDDFVKSKETITDVMSIMKKPKKVSAPISLTDLKKSDINDWSCPKFQLDD